MKKNLKSPKVVNSLKTKSLRDELAGDELWKSFSANITPLNHKKSRVDIAETFNVPVKRTPKQIKKGVRALPQAHKKQACIILPGFSHGGAVGLDSQSTRKMWRGKVKIQARLDLHGMIQTEAYISLLSFLEHAYETEKKLALVITGKGLTRNGEMGVLRQVVPRWLNEQPMKNWIRGFDHAEPSDGGEGALYVLFRKKR